ncbi:MULTISPECIES: hypothetical protein [Enorma]|uniref:hypothetical protein n=1 Tax=Enorma TaxID=1472762 RepID=UPI000349BBA3|nr:MULTISPECIES: hypothetical protein [Enorma]
MKGRNRRQETPEEREQRRQSFAKGSFYLVTAIVVIFVLAYYVPDVLGIDLAGLARGEHVVAILRIGLGVVFLGVLVASIVRAVRMFTLEGEDWKRGLRNAAATHLFSRDFISILFLLFGGIALIAWGVVDLM